MTISKLNECNFSLRYTVEVRGAKISCWAMMFVLTKLPKFRKKDGSNNDDIQTKGNVVKVTFYKLLLLILAFPSNIFCQLQKVYEILFTKIIS